MMDATNILKEAFEKQDGAGGNLAEYQQENWNMFSGLGLPNVWAKLVPTCKFQRNDFLAKPPCQDNHAKNKV